MKKRILSILLCLVLVVGLLPSGHVHAEWDEGVECEYCSEYIWGDWVCDCNGTYHCSENSDHYDCYEENHCFECGEFLGADGLKCEECGTGYECCLSGYNEYCKNCGVCAYCLPFDSICPVCGWCIECTGASKLCDQCYECGGECSEGEGHYYCLEEHDDYEYCPDCGTCSGKKGAYGNTVDLCEECGFCENCAPLCETCDKCVECEPDTHCANCYEHHDDGDGLCPGCGQCSDCADICDACGYCVDCADEDTHCSECHEETTICDACGMCDECAKSENQHCGESTCDNCYENYIYCPTCDKCIECIGEDNYCYDCFQCKSHHVGGECTGNGTHDHKWSDWKATDANHWQYNGEADHLCPHGCLLHDHEVLLRGYADRLRRQCAENLLFRRCRTDGLPRL